MSMRNSERTHWRSPVLGERRVLDLASGRIAYYDVGSGPVLVLAHGLLVNANLWRKVVQRLSSDFRCVVLDLPLGAHLLPLPKNADNTPPAVAARIVDAIEALGLEDVTLVGNDSGGALSQIVVTTRPDRIGRLVLTSCDYRDNFPPKLFAYLKIVAKVPALIWLFAQPLRLRSQRRTPIAYGWLTKRRIDREADDSYVLPIITDKAVRHDARKFILGADKQIMREAADRLGDFHKPALIAWSADDRAFPVSDAHRLAHDLPNARVELVEDSYTFSMEDNPDRLAKIIAAFVRESTTAAA